jgi:hypothetical protein
MVLKRFIPGGIPPEGGSIISDFLQPKNRRPTMIKLRILQLILENIDIILILYNL